MCGITGFIDYNKKSGNEVIKKMVKIMHHRGPDDFGQYNRNTACYSMALGHARLSILDLSSLGHQPMHYKHLSIVYNGEVYNFKEIREELININYEFSSDSDTEVVLKSYEAWGRSCVDKFIGMFAFAIYDKVKEELVICRDRAGVKPLYYYHHNGLFMFGSELKCFHQHPEFHNELDLDSLVLYFQFGYIPFPHSIFKYTFKLNPGNWLVFNMKQNDFELKEYWNVIDYYKKPKLDISFESAKIEVEKILKSACEYRMVSDVPVGVFLSGGYDSTAVALFLQNGRKEKIQTFTIGFKNSKYNEAPYAKETALYLGTEHTEFYCTEREAQAIIPELPFFYDEPFADSSAIPTTLVSKMARKKVTVALSADAGDEVFWGYNKYVVLDKWYRFIIKIPISLKRPLFIFLELICGIGGFFDKRFLRRKDFFNQLTLHYKKWESELLKNISCFTSPRILNKLFIHEYKVKSTYFDQINDFSFQENIQAVDYQTYLVDDILTKVDRATMTVSLEGREPLLDHRLIEYIAQLPFKYKFDGTTTKKILKEIVHKYIPKSMMDRPKSGFSVPIYQWLRTDLKYLLDEYLSENILKSQGIFNVRHVMKILNKFYSGDNSYNLFVWQLLMFQLWYERWFTEK